MGRNYTVKEYGDIVGALKERDPLFGLTTDIIVGFPGETEDDFQRSVEAVRDTGFSHVHVFRYSKRPGTRAAEMPNQIPEYIKKRRATLLMAEAERASAEYRAKCRGAVRQALVLGAAIGDGRIMRALTDIGVETDIAGSAKLTNTFACVTL
jgi:threonylcarbamoyladenosine tRNA methylthiotransferase MtaB